MKAIAAYLKVSRKTVYRVIGRWLEEREDEASKTDLRVALKAFGRWVSPP